MTGSLIKISIRGRMPSNNSGCLTLKNASHSMDCTQEVVPGETDHLEGSLAAEYCLSGFELVCHIRSSLSGYTESGVSIFP